MLRALFFDLPGAPAPRWTRAAMVGALLLVFAAICWSLLAAATSNWAAVWSYRAVFWRGWLLTVGISVVALALSLAGGLLLALARRSAFLPLRSFSLLVIELVRGSPLLVQILFFWYVVADRTGLSDRLVVGTLVLSLFSAAYLAEIIRAGIDGVCASQLESARSLGLTPTQIHRLVIFPQAFRRILPALAGQLASLIKDSSLLSVIGIAEFTFAAQQVNSATFSTLESFAPLALGYLLLTVPISLFARHLERRFQYED